MLQTGWANVLPFPSPRRVQVSMDEFLKRLRVGPAVLLLGQDYLRLDATEDPLLKVIDRKYGLGRGIGLTQVLNGGLPAHGHDAVAWLDHQSQLFPRPNWLETASSFAWSSLVTSAVDSSWIDAFRNDWRQLKPIYDDAQRPDQPRNKLELMCIMLFGSTRWHETAPIPLDGLSLRSRQVIVASLLRRLPELVTPRGVLAIEGYGVDDWLKPDVLIPSLAELDAGQVHIFSVSDDLARHEDVQLLAERGTLVLHKESIAFALQTGFAAGTITAGFPLTGKETGHRVELLDGVLEVPRDLWRRVVRSAQILEDDVLRAPKPLSSAARYQAFRRFLETAEGRPNWQGYNRGFAFRRNFEPKLKDLVDEALASRRLQDRPIIVHGSTGTGKTVALAHLALNIRQEREFPVLFIPHRIKPPSFDDIEEFARWSEQHGGQAVLIVWDGMRDYDEYGDLVRLMASRGRKVVLVGSMYRQSSARGGSFLEVPQNISNDEATRFTDYLMSVDPDIGHTAPSNEFLQNPEFLVSLYRLLPPSRLPLRAGVSREIGFAEAAMSRRERESTATITPRTAMEHALADAGLLETLQPILPGPTTVAGEQVSNVQKLTALVMVPGQFNLSVPLELLLRALGRDNYENFVHLLDETDIFLWDEDESGNIDIRARTAFEAQIVTQTRLGGSSGEVDVVCDLIAEMKADSLTTGGSREAEFISRLVQALDGPKASGRYEDYFNRVAGALQEMRTERSVHVLQLMLQEGHMRREWARGVEDRASTDERLDALDSGRDVLEGALELETDRYRHNYMRVNLLTELASTLATTAILQAKFIRGSDAVDSYEAAKDSIRQAQALAPDNYHPLDVLAWATFDLIDVGLLEREKVWESVTTLISEFESIDVSDGGVNLEKYLRRRQRAGELLDQIELEESAYEQLLEIGSSAGIMVSALKLAGGPRQELWSRYGALKAYEFASAELVRAPNAKDQRICEMLLNFWWFGVASERPFARERVALPFSRSEWALAARLVRDALSSGQSTREVKLLFLKALCEFHMGSYSQAIETLREVERESFGIRSRWNVVRSYVASQEDGSPRTFDGIVAEAFDGGMRGEVAVENLKLRVPFRARDFGSSPYQRGEPLPQFHIAFSFQGAIADPVSAYRVARDREDPKGIRPRKGR